MIYGFGLAGGVAAFKDYLSLADRGAPEVRVFTDIMPVLYRDMPRHDELRLLDGVYIFTEVPRLTGAEIVRLNRLLGEAKAAGREMRVLNNPLTFKARYERLRILHEAGVNRHDVVRVIEHRMPQSWPVVVRGPVGRWTSPTAGSPQELESMLKKMHEEGIWRGDKLIVEVGDWRSPDGLCRAYSAYRVGDRVVPGLMTIAPDPSPGRAADDPEAEPDEAWLTEERAHVEACTGEDQVRNAFELLEIEYGRMDYRVVDGRIQITDIDSAPELLVPHLAKPDQAARRPALAQISAGLYEAFAALETGS